MIIGLAAIICQRRNGTEAVGMDHLTGAGFPFDEGDPLDRLVQPRPMDPRPHHLVAYVHLHHRIGPIIDEPGGKAIVQAVALTAHLLSQNEAANCCCAHQPPKDRRLSAAEKVTETEMRLLQQPTTAEAVLDC